MPQAITHVFITIILVELFREYFIKDNKKFPRYYILITAIASIIPDIDYFFVYLLYPFGFTYEQVHPIFTHNIWFPLTFLIAGIITYKIKLKNNKLGKHHLKIPIIFFILAFGSFIHIILDIIFYDSIIPLYPLFNITIGINIINFFPESLRNLIFPTLDGILILFWLLWMEFKLKISDYF